MAHPDALRRHGLAVAPGSPCLTWYDLGTGARVELSRATLDNWVAKAGSLLAEEYDLGAGSVVLLDLRTHWLSAVWAHAVWALGAAVTLPGASDVRCEVIVWQPESRASEHAAGQGSAPVLACGSDPFARPLGDSCPAGALDVMAELPGYPDVLVPPAPPEPDAPALITAAGTWSGATAVARAAELRGPDTRRLLVRVPPRTVDALLATTVSPDTADPPGSCVLVQTHGLESEAATRAALAAVVRQEGLDTEVGNLTVS